MSYTSVPVATPLPGPYALRAAPCVASSPRGTRRGRRTRCPGTTWGKTRQIEHCIVESVFWRARRATRVELLRAALITNKQLSERVYGVLSSQDGKPGAYIPCKTRALEASLSLILHVSLTIRGLVLGATAKLGDDIQERHFDRSQPLLGPRQIGLNLLLDVPEPLVPGPIRMDLRLQGHDFSLPVIPDVAFAP